MVGDSLTTFKIGLYCPFPKLVARALSKFDINFAQINPNRWKTLLCLFVVIGEDEIDLTSDELRSIYFLNKNIQNKGRAYLSCIISHELHLG